ncbi:hypothetical protein, partial [Vibrio parahaemolyticus]|uniref:hypothetical protein n=1 Tax=Vibrio parahaemolyticus TaxID=670 RepID=UPI001C5F8EBB
KKDSALCFRISISCCTFLIFKEWIPHEKITNYYYETIILFNHYLILGVRSKKYPNLLVRKKE